MKKKLSRGFSLIEMSIVLIIMGLIVSSQVLTLKAEASKATGQILGDEAVVITGAVQTLIGQNFEAMTTGAAVAGYANPMAPTLAELRADGVLAAGVKDVNSLGTGWNILITKQPAACVPPACDLAAIITTSAPVTNSSGVVDYAILGAAAKKAGGDAGYSDNITPTLLSGINAAWTVANPVALTPAGIFGMRTGYGSSALSQFVRMGDTRAVSLGNTLTTAGTVRSATGLAIGNGVAATTTTIGRSNSTYGALTVTGEGAGWGGINFESSAGVNHGTLLALSDTMGFLNSANTDWNLISSAAGTRVPTNLKIGTGLAASTTTLARSNSGYGALTISGAKNGWSGINFEDSAAINQGTLMASPAYSGFYNAADNGWRLLTTDAGATSSASYTAAGAVTAGTTVNAGTSVTAGTTVNAGTSVNAGASVNAGTSVSAGTSLSAGTTIAANGDIRSLASLSIGNGVAATTTKLGRSNSAYGALTVTGEKAGWGGINFETSTAVNQGTLMAHSNGTMGFFSVADNAWTMNNVNGNQTVMGSLAVGSSISAGTSIAAGTSLSAGTTIAANGNISTASNISATGNATIGGYATADTVRYSTAMGHVGGTACTPNGMSGSDASGTLMFCDTGVWSAMPNGNGSPIFNAIHGTISVASATVAAVRSWTVPAGILKIGLKAIGGDGSGLSGGGASIIERISPTYALLMVSGGGGQAGVNYGSSGVGGQGGTDGAPGAGGAAVLTGTQVGAFTVMSTSTRGVGGAMGRGGNGGAASVFPGGIGGVAGVNGTSGAGGGAAGGLNIGSGGAESLAGGGGGGGGYGGGGGGGRGFCVVDSSPIISGTGQIATLCTGGGGGGGGYRNPGLTFDPLLSLYELIVSPGEVYSITAGNNSGYAAIVF